MAIGTDIDPAGTAVARKRGPGTSLFAKAWRTADFKIGFAIVLGLLLLSVIGPYLLNLSPTQFNVSKKFLEPWLLDGANIGCERQLPEVRHQVRELIVLRIARPLAYAHEVAVVLGVLARGVIDADDLFQSEPEFPELFRGTLHITYFFLRDHDI